MDTAYSPDDLAFRDEVRQFFDEAYTPELQQRLRSPDYKSAIEEWQRKLYEKGWVPPTGQLSMVARGGLPPKNISTRRSALSPGYPTSCRSGW